MIQVAAARMKSARRALIASNLSECRVILLKIKEPSFKWSVHGRKKNDLIQRTGRSNHNSFQLEPNRALFIPGRCHLSYPLQPTSFSGQRCPGTTLPKTVRTLSFAHEYVQLETHLYSQLVYFVCPPLRHFMASDSMPPMHSFSLM